MIKVLMMPCLKISGLQLCAEKSHTQLFFEGPDTLNLNMLLSFHTINVVSHRSEYGYLGLFQYFCSWRGGGANAQYQIKGVRHVQTT